MRKGGTVRDPVVVVGRPGQADVRELRRLYSVRIRVSCLHFRTVLEEIEIPSQPVV
jgi:hypothetical protein